MVLIDGENQYYVVMVNFDQFPKYQWVILIPILITL